MAAEEEYESSLRDLTFNSKPHISMLTMLAEENVQNAPQIVKVIEAHLHRVKPECKLPTMYLIDSIVKNVGHAYASLFVQNLVSTFCGVFEKVDEKVRSQLFRLRQTWANIFPNKKLYAIDLRVKQLDPAWPITAQPPQQPSIHVNPKFLKTTVEESKPISTPEEASRKLQDLQEEEMRKQLLAKQQELLRLQRQKLELELIQTQVMVEEQKRQLIIKEQQVLRVQQHAEAEVQKVLLQQQQQQQQQQRQNLPVPVTAAVTATSLVHQVAQAKSCPTVEPKQGSPTNADESRLGSPHVDAVAAKPSQSSASTTTTVQLTLPVMSKNKLTIDSNSVEKREPIGAATIQKTSTPKREVAAAMNADDDSLRFDVPRNHVVASSSANKSGGESVTTPTAQQQHSPATDIKVKGGDSSSSKSKGKDSGKRSKKKTPSPKKKEKSSSKDKSTSHKKKGSSKGDADRSASSGGHSKSPLHSDKDERPPSKRSRRKEKENDETAGGSSGGGSSQQQQPAAADAGTNSRGSPKAAGSPLSHKADVDLRDPIDLAVKREMAPPLEKSDGEPPVKKSKSDESDLDDSIFSGKDQDYRQLGRPVPRLSPISEQSSWAQYKASRPDEFKNPLRSRDNMPDPFGFGSQDMDLRQEQPHQTSGRPHPWVRDARLHPMLSDRDPRMLRRGSSDVFRSVHDGLTGAGGLTNTAGRFHPRMMMLPQQQIYQATQESDPNIPRALMFDRGAEIMRQADQQLRNGQLTIEQHVEIMEQLAKLYELQRMRHMQREQHVRDTVILNRKLSWEDSTTAAADILRSDVPAVDGDARNDGDDEPERMDTDVERKSEEPKETVLDATVIDVSSVPLPPSPPPPLPTVATRPSAPPVAETVKSAVVSPVKTTSTTPVLLEASSIKKEDGLGKENEASKADEVIVVKPKTSAAKDKEIEVIVIEDEPKMPEQPRHAMPPYPTPMTDRLDSVKRRESRWSSPLVGKPPPPTSAGHVGASPPQQQTLPPPAMRPMMATPPTTTSRPPPVAINTVMIDDKPREVRFIDGKAIVILENEDIREIGFRGPPQDIIFDKQVIRLGFANTIKNFDVDGLTHTIRFGAPTREVIVDGVPYAAVFGGPPITVHLCGKPHQLRMSGPTPEVFFGDQPRHDLLPLLNLDPSIPPKIGSLQQQGQPQRPDSPMSRYPGDFVGRDGPWRGGPPPQPSISGYLDEPPYRRGGFHPGDRRPDWVREEEEYHRRGGGGGAAGNRSEMLRSGRRVPDEFYDREARHSPYRGDPPQPPVDPPSGGFRSRFSHPPFHPNGPHPPPGMHPHPSMHHRFDGPGGGGPPHRPPPRHPAMVQYPIPFGYRNVAPPVHNDFGFGPPRVPAMVPPPPMPVPPPSQINVSELFSKLVATGIIPHTTKNADKAEESQTTANKNRISAEGGDAAKVPVIELVLESLRVRQATVISALYCGIQCSSCGVRFTAEQTDKYAQHLDWHFRQNRREKGGAGGGARKALLSRRWHYDLQDWVQFEEFEDLEERARSFFELQASDEPGDNSEDSVPSVPAGEDEQDKKCCVCRELFELYWDEDHEEWHFRDAVRRDDKNYHPLCYEDIKERPVDEEEAVTEETAKVKSVEASEEPEESTAVDVKNEDVRIKKEVDAVEPKVDDVKMEPEVSNASEVAAVKMESVDIDESLSIFNVKLSSYSVPPGIGLEVEPTEEPTEAVTDSQPVNDDDDDAAKESKEQQKVADDVAIEKRDAERDGEQKTDAKLDSKINVDTDDVIRPIVSLDSSDPKQEEEEEEMSGDADAPDTQPMDVDDDVRMPVLDDASTEMVVTQEGKTDSVGVEVSAVDTTEQVDSAALDRASGIDGAPEGSPGELVSLTILAQSFADLATVSTNASSKLVEDDSETAIDDNAQSASTEDGPPSNTEKIDGDKERREIVVDVLAEITAQTLAAEADEKRKAEVEVVSSIRADDDAGGDVAPKASTGHSDVTADFASEAIEPQENVADDNDDDEDDDYVRFTVLPPVMRGTELSGLCSLM